MIKKKICLLGSFAVGKTSLTKQFVHSIFSDKYLTTIGVKIDKKIISIEHRDVHLIIWDIEGEDDYSRLKESFLRGAAGYILVADGMRLDTFDKALSMHNDAQQLLGKTPAVLALNKRDLEAEWIVDADMQAKIPEDLELIKTSAKTGENVDQLFTRLSIQMLGFVSQPELAPVLK